MFNSKNIVKILLALMLVPLLLGLILQTTNSSTVSTSNKRIEVRFWNATSGTTKVVLDKLITDYNKSQDKYYVISEYQGAYGDTLSKYLSVAGTPSSPDIVQVYDIGTQIMRDSKVYTPIQDFINQTSYDKTQLEPRIAQYYSVNDQQQSMPFNTSTAIMYYNKDLLASVGVTKTPQTYEDILTLGQKLKQGNSKAKAISIQIYGWIFEQMLANQGALNMNEENGHTGSPTRSLVNSKAGYNFLSWSKQLLDSKDAINYGTDEATLVTSFLQGDSAIMIGSSAYSTQFMTTANFNVGIGGLPHPADTEAAGTAIGGASLYIGKNRPADKAAGAWDFLQYLASPKSQAQWSMDTGYFPVNTKAYQEKILVDNFKKYPELKNAVNQLQNAKNIPATSGFFSDVNVDARHQLEVAESQVFNGADLQQTLNKTAQIITDELVLAKQSLGK